MMLESGVPENDPLVVANIAMCRKYASEEYHEQDELCATCMEEGEEVQKKNKGKGKGKGGRRGKSGEPKDVDDETRDTIMALFPSQLYDPKKMVKFSVGPSSSESSRAPSLASSSRPPSLVEPPLYEPRRSEETVLYPVPKARFEYPIGDMAMVDMERFEEYFKIKAPESNNWIFYSGVGISPKEFAQFKNAADPRFNAKHFGDMYPGEVVKTHLFRYLRKETQWKASAMASYKFSCIAKGRVHLLLHRNCKNQLHPYPGDLYGKDGPKGPRDSHWELFEMWALTSMGRVTEIIRYNADDFSKVGTLWRVGMSPLGKPPDFWFPPRPFRRDSPIDHELYSSDLWT
jgi:hypothetical protein